MIVGTGITGAVTASALRNGLSETCSIHLWDKSRGSGGRMSTSRNPLDEKCMADLGAQYISCTPKEYSDHQEIYEALKSEGLLIPFEGVIEGENPYSEGTEHYVTPKGMGSVVKYFLSKTNANLQFNQQVKELNQTANGQWAVCTDTGHQETFDCVVLTMPVPQILQLSGSIAELIEKQPRVKQCLEKVSYSARYAVGLYYEAGTKINVPWSVKYFKGDPIIRYVSVDSKKRNRETEDTGPSVVIHTTVPFRLKNLEGDKESVCNNMVLPRVRNILPELPPAARVKNHKWRYSQVHRSYESSPGAVVLQERPLLLAGGDAFTYSKFDGCIESAQKLASLVIQMSQQTSSL